MKALKPFLEIAKSTYNLYMKAWKENGGKIVGYLCPNVPEELLIAANLLPFRLRAPESTETTDAEKYLNSLNCSYCRHVVDEGLKGKYDFMSGLVGTNGCDQIRRSCDTFRNAKFKHEIADHTFFTEFVNTPRVPDDDVSLQYYQEELVRLKEGLEKQYDVQITDEKLQAAIKLVNTSRTLLRKLYDLRKAEKPPISGAEMLAVTVAFGSMPKTEYNKILEQLIEALNGRVALAGATKRMFVYGGELDDPQFVKLIEDQGAVVVGDGLCFGARQVWEMVDETIDPMAAIAKRYLTRWSCPRSTDPQDRLKRVRDIVSEWHADGIVGFRMIFCQPGGAERTLSNLDAKESGIPTLWLDREYRFGGVGQMKTRIQAFLESLE
ncbi:MAG: 2-hydroxyacyl-CoA dehydratase [Desulfatitalea sp.]|nr:2-hydroxyacyl-CoA dehydratase family protein [Desulfatitalea sp.]NNK00198.1 2-hydroxyacyl-CoA dehydratase [Desulfatitalea sp.]